ncbi:MAG: hemerythrin domain-containing protein [Thermodesulfobacteriota bacterium]
MNVTRLLKQEHRLILQMTDVLIDAREKMEAGASPEAVFFQKALEGMRRFADKHHHYKEEFLLFGLLARKHRGEFQAEISALRYQHERCRRCAAEIENALPLYSRGEGLAATTILEALATYISLLKRHIHTEDHLFFPAAEKVLTPGENEHLLSLFQAETEGTGQDIIDEQFRTLIHDMRQSV